MKISKINDKPGSRKMWAGIDISGYHVQPGNDFTKEAEEGMKHAGRKVRGISEKKEEKEWEKQRATWHWRQHINSLNGCNILIKLAAGSLFSSGPSVMLAHSTKPLAILQASFQILR